MHQRLLEASKGDAKIDLSPTERGVLLALAFAGGTQRVSADLRARFGITISVRDRDKLAELGLVAEPPGRSATLELTAAGWTWVEAELGADTPRGTMGLGALYAVLGGLNRTLEKRGQGLRNFLTDPVPVAGAAAPEPEPPADDYAQRLADAAWSQAEEDIARALQDMGAHRRTLDRLQQLTGDADDGRRDKAIRQVELAGELVFQSVRQAARRRDLKEAHVRGETIPFDAAAYDSDLPLEQGTPVRVLKPAIQITRAGAAAILLRGLAEPC